MLHKIRRFILGQPGWAEYLFPPPPRMPDARSVYLGGVGVITMLRGIYNIWGPIPTGWLFQDLGYGFIAFWGGVWMTVGACGIAVAATGHRHAEWDRLAAFALLALWWGWGLIYIISGLFSPDPDRRWLDVLIGVIFIFTGIVLSAGIVQGLRKTHEIFLREQVQKRVAELESAILVIAEENERLRLQTNRENDQP